MRFHCKFWLINFFLLRLDFRYVWSILNSTVKLIVHVQNMTWCWEKSLCSPSKWYYAKWDLKSQIRACSFLGIARAACKTALLQWNVSFLSNSFEILFIKLFDLTSSMGRGRYWWSIWEGERESWFFIKS